MADPSRSAVGSSRFAASTNPALGHDNSRESSSAAASAYCHPLVPPSSSSAAAAASSSTATTTTTAGNAAGAGGGVGGFGRKRSRESSPIPPDSQLQSAIAAAAQALSNLGYFGLAGLLQQASASPSACTSDNLLNNILSVHQVRLAATKACTEQPPWIHWNRSDMASTTLRVTGQHRLGLAQHASALRGYRMARASVGCSQGCYYYECWILPGPSASEILANLPSNARLGPGLQKSLQAALEYEQQQQERERKINSTSQQTLDQERSSAPPPPPLPPLKPPPPAVGGHVRVGWSMRTGDLQAPVGYDKWSYGIRDTGGSIIHQSQRQDHWGGQGFGPGDIVGCAVVLDPIVDPVANNHVRFFKNGECMGDFVIIKGKRSGGEAFKHVVSGTYYPAVSSYMGGTIRANFGPKFVNPPRKLPPGLKLLPMSDLCKPPLDFDMAMTQLNGSSTFKLFRKAEYVQALQEAIRVEAQILTETYDNYMKQHYEDVRRARLERGLTVQDLPEVEQETSNSSSTG